MRTLKGVEEHSPVAFRESINTLTRQYCHCRAEMQLYRVLAINQNYGLYVLLILLSKNRENKGFHFISCKQ